MKSNKLNIFIDNKDHRTSYFKSPSSNIMEALGWINIDYNDKIIHNSELFFEYLKNNNIKVILCFHCSDYILNSYKDYLDKLDIYVLVYSNDLHYKNNIINEKKKYYRDLVHNFKNAFICANYYYCYLNFYDIQPNKIIKYPVYVDDDFFIEFNKEPVNKILLSGSKTKDYPARKKLNNIAEYNKNIEVLTNLIFVGYNYIKYLNKFICCFTCCANKSLPYIVGKFFEIPSTGSLLLAYDEFVKDELNNLGFIDGENYISCTLNNMEEKINYILNPDNIDKINYIRKNGYEFVWKYHKQSDRLKYIDNFVNKNLINIF